jgi:hypothetical protein
VQQSTIIDTNELRERSHHLHVCNKRWALLGAGYTVVYYSASKTSTVHCATSASASSLACNHESVAHGQCLSASSLACNHEAFSVCLRLASLATMRQSDQAQTFLCSTTIRTTREIVRRL